MKCKEQRNRNENDDDLFLWYGIQHSINDYLRISYEIDEKDEFYFIMVCSIYTIELWYLINASERIAFCVHISY